MSTSASEADVIFNRANVALVRSQKLISSWLPPKTEQETANAKTEEELLKEEDEIFTAIPEKLGVGAPLPEIQPDGSFKRTDLSSNDKLRKQLLGKNFRKAGGATPAANSTLRSKQQARTPNADAGLDAESDDDEEEGRSSLGKSKKIRKADESSVSTGKSTSSGKKRSGSYLDELLSQRKRKKKNT